MGDGNFVLGFIVGVLLIVLIIAMLMGDIIEGKEFIMKMCGN